MIRKTNWMVNDDANLILQLWVVKYPRPIHMLLLAKTNLYLWNVMTIQSPSYMHLVFDALALVNVNFPGLLPRLLQVNVHLCLFHLVARQSLYFKHFDDAITSAICITSHLALTVRSVYSFWQFYKANTYPLPPFSRRYSLSSNSWDMAPENIPNGDVSLR